MNASDTGFASEQAGAPQSDLRHRTAAQLLKSLERIAADTTDIFRFSGSEPLDADYCRRVSQLLAELVAFAVRDGRVDSRGAFVGDLHRTLMERRVSVDRLFTLVYLTERTALDELAFD